MKVAKAKPVEALVSLVIIGVVIWMFFGGGLHYFAKMGMGRIENQVAKNAEEKYQIVKRNGSAEEAYYQASMVTIAYLEAKDEENYKKWKKIEAEEARRAGIEVE